jgi:hypothetical protein
MFYLTWAGAVQELKRAYYGEVEHSTDGVKRSRLHLMDSEADSSEQLFLADVEQQNRDRRPPQDAINRYCYKDLWKGCTDPACPFGHAKIDKCKGIFQILSRLVNGPAYKEAYGAGIYGDFE